MVVVIVISLTALQAVRIQRGHRPMFDIYPHHAYDLESTVAGKRKIQELYLPRGGNQTPASKPDQTRRDWGCGICPAPDHRSSSRQKSAHRVPECQVCHSPLRNTDDPPTPQHNHTSDRSGAASQQDTAIRSPRPAIEPCPVHPAMDHRPIWICQGSAILDIAFLSLQARAQSQSAFRLRSHAGENSSREYSHTALLAEGSSRRLLRSG